MSSWLLAAPLALAIAASPSSSPTPWPPAKLSALGGLDAAPPRV